ncbi:MAG: hypothetical protein ACK501_13325 [Planctomycetota bacterium]|jgi:hypothetical protein
MRTFGSKRRLDRVKHWLATCPIPQRVVDEAFDAFRFEGELPDDQRLAELVCGKAGYRNVPTDPDGVEAVILRVVAQAAERLNTDAEPLPLVRDVLFDEALYGPDPVKRWARKALRVLVCRGGDVTDPMLANEHGLPEFGTVGMHVLGYPRRLATAPYEEQGRRLFDRYDEIRRRMNYSADEDFGPMAEAFLAFEERGELPKDELMRDYVLAEYEIEMLREHRAGRDVAGVMALLDRAATATGEEREAAVGAVQRFVRARTAG